MKETNKFTEYFGNDIFDTLLKVKDEINPVNIREISPKVFDEVRNEVIPQIFQQLKDPATVLHEAQAKLKQ
ncbi:putative arabinose-binding protein precursor [compost metagenome]